MREQVQEAEVTFRNGFVSIVTVWKDGPQWFADRISEPLPVEIDFIEEYEDVKCFDEIRSDA